MEQNRFVATIASLSSGCSPSLTESADEFLAFEVARIGYDVQTKQEIFVSNEDADDLLLLVLGDSVEPAIFEGIVWAVQNRPVNWPLHLARETYTTPEHQAALRDVRLAAGLPQEALTP